MNQRKLCPVCSQNPVAINYVRNGKTHYRNVCGVCARKGKKLKPQPPQWYRAGYRKKPQCERCGFKAESVTEQLLVYHVDGDLRNTDRTNLKTVCMNCRPMIAKTRLPWKTAGIVPDF